MENAHLYMPSSSCLEPWGLSFLSDQKYLTCTVISTMRMTETYAGIIYSQRLLVLVGHEVVLPAPPPEDSHHEDSSQHTSRSRTGPGTQQALRRYCGTMSEEMDG